MKKFTMLLIIAVGVLVASVTDAGTIRLGNDGTFIPETMSTEVANASAAQSAIGVGDTLDAVSFEYVASISGVVSDNSRFILDLDTSTVSTVLLWNVGSSLRNGSISPLTVCNSTGLIVASYLAGDGLDTLLFSASGVGPNGDGSFVSGQEYYLYVNDNGASPPHTTQCTGSTVALSNTNLTIDFPKNSGDLVFGASIVTSGSVVVDSSTATLIDMKDEFSADMTVTNVQRLTHKIDYESDFEKLWDGSNAVTTDTLAVTLNSDAANITYDTNSALSDGTKDVFSLVLTPSSTTGIVDLEIDVDAGSSNVVAATDLCVPDDTGTPTYWTCTWDTRDHTSANWTYQIDVNVDGTSTLSGVSWTATAGLAFGATGEAADWNTTASANMGKDLFTDSGAGKWTYRGTACYVPLARTNTDTGLETYFKFQSTDTSAAGGQLRAIVLLSDGTTETVDMGTITAGIPLAFTATDIVALLTGTVNGQKGFALTLNITSDATELYGLVTMVTPDGAQRRIPLSTDHDISGNEMLGSGIDN